MGSYFAGAGWLMIQGALRMVCDLPLASTEDFVALFQIEVVWRWLPAIIAAAFIRWAIRNWPR